jgi:hypothetical protein
MSKFIRLAQADPAAAAAAPPPDPSAGMGMPATDPGMALGMPSLGGGMGGGMGAPTAGGAGGPTQTTSSTNLKYPLENMGMILKDANVEKLLAETFSSSKNEGTNSEEELANKIWQEYGGDKFGGVSPGKLSERVPKKEVDDKEVEATDDSKWKRLPAGKNLDDLDLTLEDMVNSIKAISFGISKAKSKEAPAGGGGGGLMASVKHHRRMVRLSETLDNLGFHHLSDKITPII